MAGFNITNKNVDSLFKTAEKGVVVDGDKKDSNDTNSTDNTISADNAGSAENTVNTDNKNAHNAHNDNTNNTVGTTGDKVEDKADNKAENSKDGEKKEEKGEKGNAPTVSTPQQENRKDTANTTSPTVGSDKTQDKPVTNKETTTKDASVDKGDRSKETAPAPAPVADVTNKTPTSTPTPTPAPAPAVGKHEKKEVAVDTTEKESYTPNTSVESNPNRSTKRKHVVGIETIVPSSVVEKVVTLYNHTTSLDKDTLDFIATLLTKKPFDGNTLEFITQVINLDDTTAKDSQSLYSMISINDRVDRVFALLDFDQEQLRRIADIMQALNKTNISAQTHRELAREVEQEIENVITSKGADFFADTKKQVTDIILCTF